MVINYKDLCAYCVSRTAELAFISDFILSSWGIPVAAATEEDLTQAKVEATDELVRDYFASLGILAMFDVQSIVKGQPNGAECRLARGYVK